jgi:hypothetical protein
MPLPSAALSQRFIRFLASLCVRVCIFIFNLVCIDQFDLTILKALNSCAAEKGRSRRIHFHECNESGLKLAL